MGRDSSAPASYVISTTKICWTIEQLIGIFFREFPEIPTRYHYCEKSQYPIIRSVMLNAREHCKQMSRSTNNFLAVPLTNHQDNQQ